MVLQGELPMAEMNRVVHRIGAPYVHTEWLEGFGLIVHFEVGDGDAGEFRKVLTRSDELLTPENLVLLRADAEPQPSWAWAILMDQALSDSEAGTPVVAVYDEETQDYVVVTLNSHGYEPGDRIPDPELDR